MQDNPHHAVSDHFFEDSSARLQYQHEYTLAGLKTLIIINGGAIIGLLTYAGNASGKVQAAQFNSAFMAYAAGLILAVLTYLTAYLSQAEFMNGSILEAYQKRGLETTGGPKTKDEYDKRGTLYVAVGILLAVGSLAGFGTGSYFAKQAISSKTPVAPLELPRQQNRSPKAPAQA